METKRRIHFLDEMRGFAILCMVVHHFFYTVGYLLDQRWGYEVFDFLCYVQPIFWVVFIVTSGVCVQLSRSPLKRGAFVFGVGLLFTLVTAVLMPLFGFGGEEIYFGILHFLGAAMIIFAIFRKLLDKINIKAGMIISLLLFTMTYNVQNGYLFFENFLRIDLPDALYQTSYLFPLGFYSASFHSADYFPLLPWLFLFLAGSFMGRYAKAGAFPEFTYRSHSKFLQMAGRNSLWIYILHQPVFYAVLLPISKIFM